MTLCYDAALYNVYRHYTRIMCVGTALHNVYRYCAAQCVSALYYVMCIGTVLHDVHRYCTAQCISVLYCVLCIDSATPRHSNSPLAVQPLDDVKKHDDDHVRAVFVEMAVFVEVIHDARLHHVKAADHAVHPCVHRGGCPLEDVRDLPRCCTIYVEDEDAVAAAKRNGTCQRPCGLDGRVDVCAGALLFAAVHLRTAHGQLIHATQLVC